MTDPHADRSSAFRKDLDRLAREAEQLTERFRTDSRLAREEAVGAEIIATRELVAHLGIMWNTVEQLSDLAGRQIRHFSNDYLATLSTLLDGRAGEERAAVLSRHVERRLAHVAEGIEQGIEVMSTQSERACDTLVRLWAPFFSVLRRDWTRQPARANA